MVVVVRWRYGTIGDAARQKRKKKKPKKKIENSPKKAWFTHEPRTMNDRA
jgi:hypothetical protein